ncbi:hypothetical protein CDCA_CDCA02G0649 [Cyanidium caldarium]|uniref:Uncharacterized protein n=1 Tax=Cyanidium caldarium TaxID=2771 RepID=A0AAV9IQU3_CYACA|nr:hypothetical protein CDCA_CDCA02G0649 [Cyanidium caldarium]
MGSVWRGLRGTTLATHLGALVRTFGGERTRPATWLARRGVSSGPSHYSEDELRRYVRQIRAESNETSWDDPPTAPLPETNELYEGASDFSNFLDRHEDMSPRQAYGGLALGMGFFAVLGALAFQRSKAKERPYVPREVPGYNRDIFGSDVPPDVAAARDGDGEEEPVAEPAEQEAAAADDGAGDAAATAGVAGASA